MDKERKEFRYQQIYQTLLNQILDKQLQEGHPLKTEKELQEEFHVSRDTVRKALFQLEVEGYIERKPAIGTFVRKPKSDYTLRRMKSFTEQMKERGLKPSSEILSIEICKDLSKTVSLELNCTGSKKVYRVTRIRYADDVPMAHEVVYIPQELCPDLQQHLHKHASLYQIYERSFHLNLKYGKVFLEAGMPSAYLQEVLHMKKHTPILKMRCTGYLDNDIPLYYVECDYVGEHYIFSTLTDR